MGWLLLLQSSTYWEGVSKLKGNSKIQRASDFILSVTNRLIRANLAPGCLMRAELGTCCCVFRTSLKVIFKCRLPFRQCKVVSSVLGFLEHHLGPNSSVVGFSGRALTLEIDTFFSISLYWQQDGKNNPIWWQHIQKQGRGGAWLNLFEKAYLLLPFFVTQARGDVASLPPFCCHYLPCLSRNQSQQLKLCLFINVFWANVWTKADLHPESFSSEKEDKFLTWKISEPIFVNKV